MGVVLVIKEFLPLPDHSEKSVVEDGDLYRKVVLDGRGQLLYIHLDASVTGDVEDELIREGRLCANSRGKPVAHGAQPAGSQERPRPVKRKELRGPHLVLTHFG
jgi:hypothetical protein